MNNAPIGVFDSGMGGLSIWKELRAAFPNESFVYYGDGKNCPYGGKSREEITKFADRAFQAMSEQGVKMVVVACNTATIAAIDFLRAKYDIPIVGMEPAVKPAALSTQSGIIAVLATESSLEGDLFNRTAETFAAGVQVLTASGKGFVDLVEKNMEYTPEAETAVREVVAPLIEKGADMIVLGCTHYPFLKEAIEKVIAGRNVEIIDPAQAIARRVGYLLKEGDIAADSDNIPRYLFMTSSDEDYLERIISKSGQGDNDGLKKIT